MIKTAESYHIPVLLNESIEGLNLQKGGIYVDVTMGGGGHTLEILNRMDKDATLFSFDQDLDAYQNMLQSHSDDIAQDERFVFVRSNFRYLKNWMRYHGVEQIDGLLADLGVSSHHFDDENRGFSFRFDSPLDMRMNRHASLSAYQVVNDYDYHDLVRIFFKYGEDKFSKQIARKIEQARQVKPIETTTELADIIKSAKPAKELKKKGHPAKQIFQAIRIEVNDELGAADESIQQAIDLLAVDGRISVITFHSLEDRLTKQLFKEASTVEVPKGLPFIPEDLKPKLELVHRKPILPSVEELKQNNRAHSAKLRVARKVHK